MASLLSKRITLNILKSFPEWESAGFPDHKRIYLPVSYSNFLKVFAGVVYLLFKPSVKERFVFLEHRNIEIANSIGLDDSIFLAGFASKRKEGIKNFNLLGLISALTLACRQQIYWPLDLYIKFFRFRFRLGRKIFFVHEDTLPTGIFLSLFSSASGHIPVCVEHGAPLKGSKIIDGRRCPVNLLIGPARTRLLPVNTVCFEIGMPYEIPVRDSATKPQEVIFVGTGWTDDITLYKQSLEYFELLGKMLSNSGINFIYRPHPIENSYKSFINHLELDKRSKKEILSCDPKVFVGFASTLLYEASYFGHPVVELILPEFEHLRLIDLKADHTLYINKTYEFPLIIKSLLENEYQLNSPKKNFQNRLRDIVHLISTNKDFNEGVKLYNS